ncbi:MAG: HlyD family efflux transporter periplasmic adaptor subunit [Alphaproteobacteria bacterium]
MIAGVCGVLLAGGLVYAFWPRPVPVDLGEASRGSLRVTVDDEGRTRVKEVYVVSAPVAGHARRIEIHVGDEVVTGETVLAEIQEPEPTFLDVRSKRQAQAEVKAAEAAKTFAEAEVERARAEIEFARTELERARLLAARGNISQRALDNAELEVKIHTTAVATTEASLRVREFELETARAALIEPGEDGAFAATESKCCVEVRAPVSGRVLRVLHESEGVVAAGTPLVEIGDPRELEVEVDLLSSDAVNVVEGAEVEIVRWGGGEMLAGRVRRVEPYGFTKVSALGIEEQRVNVIIDFTDPPENWRPLGHGYRVETRIVVWRGDDVLKLPLSALFRDGGAWAVFVLDDGRARLRHVGVGRMNSVEAQILDGLDEGEQVVLYPSDRVFDDVRIIARPRG